MLSLTEAPKHKILIIIKKKYKRKKKRWGNNLAINVKYSPQVLAHDQCMMISPR
jgi:hypothetical protein